LSWLILDFKPNSVEFTSIFKIAKCC